MNHEPRCTCAATNAVGATSPDYRCEACTDGEPPGEIRCSSVNEHEANPDCCVEMRHCDGCDEDYNAFEESHVEMWDEADFLNTAGERGCKSCKTQWTAPPADCPVCGEVVW